MANLRKRYTWKPPAMHPSPGAASHGRVAEDDDDNDSFGMQWRKYPMEKLLDLLGSTSPRGLTSAVAAGRLQFLGDNELETKKQGMLYKLLSFLLLAVDIAATAAMVAGLARGGRHAAIGSAVVALLAADFVVGFVVGFVESHVAGIAAANAVLARLAPPGRLFWVLRDGVWSGQNAAAIVLGDIIHIRPGDVIPVDARLLETATGSPPMPIEINESALTGDPLPVAKGPGDAVYAGSTCANGKAQAVVVAAGNHTYLADAVRLADATDPSQRTCLRVLSVFFRAVWNAFVVWACFAVLVDAVKTEDVSSYGRDRVFLVRMAA